ncbi:hypothetical protein [Brevundimonas sp.]|uniref:hypothetical protein n=1 Tax=Brevundimonas sp. TaxID=1871086 RepID=UPI0027319C5A|nr:hypothetical protein [Brevundimonas sp.]MDP1914122.1 hypothetical protein [Brevundimonas sp.]
MSDETAARPRRRRQAAPAPTTPDPIEIAMEAEARDLSPDSPARQVLVEHRHLIRAQIAQARRQAVRELAIMAFVGMIVLSAGLVVWNASRANGLVIQPFTVPPALTERGLDGTAVASLLQDELTRLDAATESGRAPASFRNDWSDNIAVGVEAGGVSLDDAWRFLVRRLGRETYMTGGVSEGPDGLTLVVRTGADPIPPVTGPAEDLTGLLSRAAESVYEQTQPYRYAVYLGGLIARLPDGPERVVRRAQQTALLMDLSTGMSNEDRAWAYNGLGLQPWTTAQENIPFIEAGLELDPEHPYMQGNLASRRESLGHAEIGWTIRQRWAENIDRNLGDLNPAVRRRTPFNVKANALAASGAYLDSAKASERAQALAPTRSEHRADGISRASRLILAHDGATGLRLLRRLGLSDDVGVLLDVGTVNRNLVALSFATLASDLERWPEAVTRLQALDAAAPELFAPRDAGWRSTLIWPMLAHARARSGDLVGARALIAATPLDCYLCVRERARIAEIAGDRRSADRWFAEAIRQAPSLPFAYAERGQALLARGDGAGAIALFRQAHEKGPRWADPLKFWGDALAAQGDHRGAVRKYRAAAAFAPRWGALHLAWGKALAAQGRADAAREKYREAARLDLSDSDRAEVVHLRAVR